MRETSPIDMKNDIDWHILIILNLLVSLLQNKLIFVNENLELDDQMDGPPEHQYIHELSLTFQYAFEWKGLFPSYMD